MEKKVEKKTPVPWYLQMFECEEIEHTETVKHGFPGDEEDKDGLDRELFKETKVHD